MFSNTYTGTWTEYNPALNAAAFPTLDTPELTEAWYDQQGGCDVKSTSTESGSLASIKDEKIVTVRSDSIRYERFKDALHGHQPDRHKIVKLRDVRPSTEISNHTRGSDKPRPTKTLNAKTSPSMHHGNDPLPWKYSPSSPRVPTIYPEPARIERGLHRSKESPTPRWDDGGGNLQERQFHHDMESSDEGRGVSRSEMLDPAHQRNRASEMHRLWDSVSPIYKLHVVDMVSSRYSRQSQDTRVRLLQLTESQVNQLADLQTERQAREAEEDAGRVELYSEVNVCSA